MRQEDELILAVLARHRLVAADGTEVARRSDLIILPLHGLLVRVVASDEHRRGHGGRLTF